MVNQNAQPEPIQITFAKGTDVGRARDHNEDYVDAFSPPDPAQRRRKGDLFIVADGMGGHQAGEVASEGAVRVISHEYYADPDPDVRASLVRAIQKANTFVYQQAQQVMTRAGMGTTVVAAVVRGWELCLANVGDSRAYLMRQGQINQVTRDHSFVEEQIRAGILSREEARTHAQRNVITRALGSKPEVKVDTYSGELKPGDILLLCSDGLSGHVREEDMAGMLSQHPPREAVPRLIALANKRGGSDNISVLVAQAAPPAGVAPPQPAAPAARPAAAPARRGLSLPLTIGIAAVGLIVVAALVAGAFLVLPGLGKETPIPTPTVTPSAMPTGTATPLPPTMTPSFTESAPTVTPVMGFSLLEPLDELTIQPGNVTFQWRWIGEWPEPFTFVITTTGHGELCSTDQESCLIPLGAGVYEWWVELRGGPQIMKSDRWILRIVPPPTPTYTPEPTSPPTPAEAPATQPPAEPAETKPPPTEPPPPLPTVVP
ncbi:MAG: Stp1/IreP family PP2C-type Ser/Thr phosphatase [Chloroflexi bacterium]|jgi:serine/threonine protein phosphatase PrpC|nr:Stp1/IreP family PP2C-type Ser/Thr phosphatase [Chloroflexota bacterium]